MKTYTQFCSFVLVILILMFSQGKAQFVQQGGKLIGTGSVGTTVFQGLAVSVSADGNTAIVGGYGTNNDTGAVWVYTRSGGVWTQQGNKLVGFGAVGAAGQGISVSISADGNTAIVGGPYDNNYAGAAWVFGRAGGVWTQQGLKLVGTGAVQPAYQGGAVAISGDGNTVIVGGSEDNNLLGAAWVYVRSGSIWIQQGSKLVATGSVGSYVDQGISVSLSGDGNTAIVGGSNDNSNVGAAWVYSRSGGVWSQQGNKLVGTGAVVEAYQGWSVSISFDGNTAIVGGALDDGGKGAAWVYNLSGGVWTQQGTKLVGSGGIVAQQGYSVSLSGDGNTAIVGGPHDGDSLGGLITAGAAWVFTRSRGAWTQQGSKLVGSGATGNAEQGSSVSLSSDGRTAIVGGWYDNKDEGAVWAYYSTGAPVITSILDVPNDQGGKVTINWQPSFLDTNVNTLPYYSIWRAIPGGSAAVGKNTPKIEITLDFKGPAYRTEIINDVAYNWEWIANQPAHRFTTYSYTASTLFDSMSTTNAKTYFLVSAQTSDPNVFYDSYPDSGYSVDNIPPLAPQNLVLNTQSYPWVLHWNPNTEPDLGRYAVYKSANPITNPSLLQPLGYTTDTAFVDNVPSPKVYYIVLAEDIHNNLSPPSNQVVYGVTGVSENGNGIPTSFALAQNYPNPFNPTTVINYSLPKQAFVRLTVYSILGQEVATLVNEIQSAGYKSVDFNGNNFPSGMYFYKVTAGTFTQVKKMVLLK